ncbi:MAG: selenocysteine-specific translation elongation factor [Dehalococcoidales bacterium]|nr:selenocysteine-specific translation elongation factor [Dehalococcoidales bacterium]
MFVLGTAGHIDHGKSALVQALSGMDPDRLSEEKERGMTIDLGFAWFKLPSGQEVGIVDVPGHERFIKNMLAGVGSIDLALLVVAANEGVMPQTREHLAIIDLLGIQKGVVAITKKDLVDEEWLGLVKMDIEELISHTSLSRAPIVSVSATTKEGLPELVAVIDGLLLSTEPRKDMGRPRLPIDRVFTIAGSGTIVTGTLLDGSLSLGEEVEIVPSGLRSRLRGLQTHKAHLNTAVPGSRVAVNLVGISTSQLQRGDVLTKPGWLTATTMLSAQLRLLGHLRRPLPHNAEVSFHSGAAEAMAKVRLLEKEKLEPGQSTWVQLVLDKPVALVNGDRFIIRSPMETLGGGKVIDAHAKRLRRFRDDIIQSLKVKDEGTIEEVTLALLETRQPVELAGFLSQLDHPADESRLVLASLIGEGRVIGLGQGEHSLLFTAPGWQRLTRDATAIVDDYHHKFPTRSGMPKVELSSRLKLSKHFPAILPRLVEQGHLSEAGLVVRLPSHRIQLTPAQQTRVDAFLKALAQNPYSPPGDGIPEPDLLNWLVEQHQVVKVSDNIVFATAAYNGMVARVTAHMKAHGKVTLGEARDLFQTSRKYAQAFLENLDDKKITRRVGDERVLY